MTNIFLALYLLLIPTIVLANGINYNWIIGGGPLKESSEIQIERNVKWAAEVIKRQSEQPALKVFFTDGNNPAPDVVAFYSRDLAMQNNKYIFDLVFGGTNVHPRKFTNNTVPDNSGTTHPDYLIPALKKDFSQLTENDTALILYNGHGWGDSGYRGLYTHTLRLWGETSYTVDDFENLLSYINDKTPTRFILTQCYSGGFARLIHPEAQSDTLALKGNRCGFMAESASAESEGCSASLKIEEYRDYTTFMFAALDGKTRLGEALEYNPDLNNDGRVSLREAHFYAIANAYSIDMSRSTSEYYLEKWQPWYLRWLPRESNSENSVFHRTMIKVHKINKMPAELLTDPSALRAEWHKRTNRFENLERDSQALSDAIKSTQKIIIKKIEQNYPDIQKQYADNFNRSSKEMLADIRAKITESEQLDQLQQHFSNKDELDLVLLDAERALTQVEKIARLQKLSRIDVMFSRFASTKIRRNLEQLISCEDSTL